jgi:DnaJ-class molecular chaperone
MKIVQMIGQSNMIDGRHYVTKVDPDTGGIVKMVRDACPACGGDGCSELDGGDEDDCAECGGEGWGPFVKCDGQADD